MQCIAEWLLTSDTATLIATVFSHVYAIFIIICTESPEPFAEYRGIFIVATCNKALLQFSRKTNNCLPNGYSLGQYLYSLSYGEIAINHFPSNFNYYRVALLSLTSSSHDANADDLFVRLDWQNVIFNGN